MFWLLHDGTREKQGLGAQPIQYRQAKSCRRSLWKNDQVRGGEQDGYNGQSRQRLRWKRPADKSVVLLIRLPSFCDAYSRKVPWRYLCYGNSPAGSGRIAAI